MRRVAGSVFAAGAVLFAGGLFLGLKPVADCGSAFSPADHIMSSAADCSAPLASRDATAWELIVLGLATTAASALLYNGEGMAAAKAEREAAERAAEQS